MGLDPVDRKYAHVGNVLKMCSQQVYLLKVLREQGLSCRQVHAISSVDCIECDFGMPACQLEVVFAVRCYANADYAIMRCLSVCLSVCVCVSITFVHSVKTNKHIFDLRYVKYSMYRQFHRTADRHGVTYAALQSYSLGSIASAVILFFFWFFYLLCFYNKIYVILST